MAMSVVASTRGVALLPEYARNFLTWSVTSRPLEGETPHHRPTRTALPSPSAAPADECRAADCECLAQHEVEKLIETVTRTRTLVIFLAYRHGLAPPR
jgi:hypothetical protein